jgi:hypothetical protein
MTFPKMVSRYALTLTEVCDMYTSRERERERERERAREDF